MCGDTFGQRLDGRPRTCSRTCARTLEWRSRERKQRLVHSNGYIMIYSPEHPRATTKMPYAMEHHLAMEEHLGRHLESFEIVHHKNGIRSDNRLENLELWAKWTHLRSKDGPGQRVEDLIAFVVEHYPNEVREALCLTTS